MSCELGNRLRVSIFGESHGRAVGGVAEGLPAGETIDMEVLSAFMERRRPGRDALSTKRQEADIPVFLSGVKDGKITGAPLALMIENTDAHSADYAFSDTPRPSHADYTAFAKWQGCADMRGGGPFSGRLTAPVCALGGIALQILARRGIFIGAHLMRAGGVSDSPFPLLPEKELFHSIAAKPIPVIDDAAGGRMREATEAARSRGDSVGGEIECAVIGLPPGLGEPLFGGLESRLSAALFGIPGVKGVSFGSGFSCADMTGSLHNDPFVIGQNGGIMTETNNSGGLQGGISNGMPVITHIAVKPTPSIALPQKTVSISEHRETTIAIKGRHDPLIAHRAVPVAEAAVALVILDILLGG